MTSITEPEAIKSIQERLPVKQKTLPTCLTDLGSSKKKEEEEEEEAWGKIIFGVGRSLCL